MFNKWELVKTCHNGVICYHFACQVDADNTVHTLAVGVQDGDELSALLHLCDLAKDAEHPLLDAFTERLKNAEVRDGGGEA